MTERRKKTFYVNNPRVVLNGLVTDRNEYSYEEKKKLLNKRKKLSEKKISRKEANKVRNKRQLVKEYESIINLSEDSDSFESPKINSEIKVSKIKINNRNKNKKLNKNEIIFDEVSKNSMHEIKKNRRKISENKKKEKPNKKIIKKNKKESKKEIINNFINNESDNNDEIIITSDNNNDNDEEYKIFNKKEKDSSEETKPNIHYKNVELGTQYEDIKNNLKNNSCVYISLFDTLELRSIIEKNSIVLQLFKKIKKIENDNIIISSENNEKNLIRDLNNFLSKKKEKYELFKKFRIDCNNILDYLPNKYCGINLYGFMNINSSSKNKEELINFITPFFKDRTDKYILKFRKYILNLSLFTSNAMNIDNNLYHIIIPKENTDKIDIDFNEEMDLNDFLKKLNCDYYFYQQRPGELLIVEPGCIHLSYYTKKKSFENLDKNYLIMFWNKMDIDSFSDYLTLKKDCLYEEYKHLPIVSMLFNLANKKLKYLSGNNISTIVEIYNKLDLYENINNYINEINNNNLYFHKLYLNNIDICNNCEQEIFNFFVYDNGNDEDLDYESSGKNTQFICINCAYKKNLFSIQNSLIFFKYEKKEIESFISKITSNINKTQDDINIVMDSNNNDQIISETFDLNNRQNDCININDLYLKSEGLLKVLDKDYNNNNFGVLKNIKVYKYLKYLEKERLNAEEASIDVLNIDKDNYNNDSNENDIYEIINTNDISHKNNSVLESISGKIIVSKIKTENKEYNNFNKVNEQNRFEQLLKRGGDNMNESITKSNNQIKSKKRKIKNVSDLIASGGF